MYSAFRKRFVLLLFTLALCALFITGIAAQDQTATPDDVVEIGAPAEGSGETELSGEIDISIASNDVQTYQVLADAYTALHPNVTVSLELKPAAEGEAYLQFVRAQFATGAPRVSVIESPHFRDLAQEGLLLNWAPYLQQVNPYTSEKWEESFEDWALNLVRDPNTGEMYTMPYMSVQTFWVYNKRIFAEAGITDVPAQPTWDQLVEWSEKNQSVTVSVIVRTKGNKLNIQPYLVTSTHELRRLSDEQIITISDQEVALKVIPDG